MDGFQLDEIDEIINQLSSPESGYESEIQSEIRDFYTSYGNELGCHLKIVEQPGYKYRFRYITEFKDNPHGPLLGEHSTKTNKTFPTVKLNNYNRKAIIRCWLCVNVKKEVHVHQLLTKNDGRGIRSEPHDIVVDTKNNFTAVFEGLNIIHAVTKGKKEYLECLHQKKCHIQSGFKLNSNIFPYDEKALKSEVKAMEKNKAVLFFEAFDYESHNKLCEIFSCEIKNSKNPKTSTLKISRQSHEKGPVNGGTEVLIFVEKVTKDIKVRFFENDDAENTIWEEYATIEDIWHQVAIAFRTPAYRDLNIEEDHKVYFQLIRGSDNSFSNEMEFHYQPDYRNQTVYFEPLIGKKRRMEVVNTFTPPAVISVFNNDQDLSQYDETNVLKDVYLTAPQVQTDFSDILQDLCGTNTVNLPRVVGWGISPNMEEQINLPDEFESDSVLGTLKEELPFFTDSAKDEEQNIHNKEELDLIRSLFKCVFEPEKSKLFYETLKKLKDIKINVDDLKNSFYKTPLLMAIEQGRLDFVKPLLEAGFNVNAVDIDHNSALHLAIIYNADYIIADLIVAGADLKISNYDGETPLHLGCRKRKLSCLNQLINEDVVNCQSKKTGDTPLHIVAKYGFLEEAKILLKRGASVQAQNYGNYTPLDFAVQFEHENMVKLLLESMDSKDRRNIFLVDVIRTKVQSEQMCELLEDYLKNNGEQLGITYIVDNNLSNSLMEKCTLEE